MAKELVQNEKFGEPAEPTHVWKERLETPPGQWTPQVSGTGNMAGAILAPFLAAWLVMFFYPLTSVPVLWTWYMMERVADARVGRGNWYPYVAVIALPMIVVLYAMMRLDQRMGEWRPYRWTRHAARLLIAGVMFNLGTRGAMSLRKDVPVGRLISDTFSNSTLLTATIGAMVVMHLFFWLATGMRENWHRWLRVLRLRSSKLKD